MRKITPIFTLFLSIFIIPAASAEPNDTKDIDAVQAAYYQWVADITTAKGNPDQVMKLYAPNTILLATLETRPLKKPEAIKAYFEGFTALKDLSADTSQLVTLTNDEFGLNNGIYTFHYIDDNGKPISIKARFTFAYKKIDGKWLIINHHSSAAPE